ncbi:MAG TPA: hypothetical protein PLI09_11565 [Candidatus Hydrogenedentes bacterium]|nr:hypothetical protein [Candidatus Hydrogenedentota bacterium]
MRKQIFRNVVGVSLVAFAIVFVLATVLMSCPPPAAPGTFGNITQFVQLLQNDGFTVQEGRLNEANPVELFCDNITPSCYAFNKSTPYCVYLLPPAPNQPAGLIDPYPFGSRLRADEALVFVGYTPPPCKYFGYQMYLGLRYAHWMYHNEEINSYKRVYADVGDAINNMTIKTGRSRDGKKTGSPFDSETIIIYAADKGVADRVCNALLGAGATSDVINVSVLPSQYLRMGAGATDDIFTSLHRVAFFDDPADDAAYFPGTQVEPIYTITEDGVEFVAPPYESNFRGHVYRVSPTTPLTGAQLNPYPAPTLRSRGTGITEHQYTNTMENLRDAILAQYAAEDYEAIELDSYVWLYDGYEYIQRELDGLGETRDTIYLRSSDFELGPDDFAVVYGPVHALTGKSTYSSLTLYSSDLSPDAGKGIYQYFPEEEQPLIYDGLFSISDADENGLCGTAGAYLPNDPNADLFYAWVTSRQAAAGANETQVPAPDCDRIPLEKFCVGFRAYLEPGTNVGPDAAELIFDQVIVFHKK